MDEFDDIDSLLDLEEVLREEADQPGPSKRVLNDLNAQPASQVKRLRTDSAVDHSTAIPRAAVTAGAATETQEDDDELLALAAQAFPSQLASQHVAGPAVLNNAQNPPEAPPSPTAPEPILPGRPYVPPAKNVVNIQGECMTVTGPDGERVYCHVCEAHDDGGIGEALRGPKTGLLSENIQDLIDAVEKDVFQRALAEIPDDDPRSQQQQQAENITDTDKVEQLEKQQGKGVSSLWVDQYAPQNFMDLLGNEQINRDVVRWVKSWDPCVFNRAAPAPAAHTTYRKHQQQNQQQGSAFKGNNNNSRFNNNNKDSNAPEFDALGRPEHKILLLCGPPGIGKTTLAHVVARHCGYRPYEINASDDRNSSALMNRVQDAAEMKSVLGECLPNCIIIDEIDGATGGAEGRGAITALLKMVTAQPRQKQQGRSGGGGSNNTGYKAGVGFIGANGNEEDDSDDEGMNYEQNGNTGKGFGGKGGGKGKRGPRPLMRPIICICNDAYAPALRPLREVARVFHFKKPAVERLVHRLQAVCATEGLRAEKSTLRVLAEKTDCDIRSCLNTLQFISKRQTAVRLYDLEGMNVGQKDMTKGAFHIWGELFQTQRPRAMRPMPGRRPERDRFSKTFSMLQDFGEEELVINGIHENLPNAAFLDMTLQRTSRVLSLLQDADKLLRGSRASSYIPAVALSISGLIASHERRQLQWPKTGADVFRRSTFTKSLVQQWTLSMVPSCFAALGRGAAVVDVVPALPHITGPPLRPVSFHLFSKDEKTAVDTLVDTLHSLGLNFSLHDTTEAANHAAGVTGRDSRELPLLLRPPIHQLWTYEGRQPAVVRILPPAIRQMVAHEVDMESIRRAEAIRRKNAELLGGDAEPEAMQIDNQPNAPATFVPAAANPAVAGPVQLDLAQRLREAGRGVKKTNTAAPKGTWLDQVRAVHGAKNTAAAQRKVEMEKSSKVELTVLYKYHEGFTNAVKRPTLLSELL